MHLVVLKILSVCCSRYGFLENEMKFKTLYIHWHKAGAPILTVDFNSEGKLATGGGDSFIRVFHAGSIKLKLTLSYGKFLWVHRMKLKSNFCQRFDIMTNQSTVSVLLETKKHLPQQVCLSNHTQWQHLISKGDDGCIILWKFDDTPYTPFELKDEDIADNVERWKAYKTFLYQTPKAIWFNLTF